MPLFEYRASSKAGEIAFGRIEGNSIGEVAAKLRDRGLYPIKIEPFIESPTITLGRSSAPAKTKAGPQREKKTPLKVLTLFCRQFAVMINAGLPLMPCIRILERQCEHAGFRQVLTDVRFALESGESLSRAMSRHPKSFPPIMIHMIEAGEAGGVLDRVLNRVAEHFEKESALIAKVKSAMTYPVIVLVVAVGVTAALIMFVLPMFAEMFSGANVELPFITRFLLSLSDFLKKNILYILGVLGAIAFGVVSYVRTPTGRRQKDELMLRLPLFGPLTLKMITSRFARTFSTLLASGVPMLQCLEIVGRVVTNVVAAEKLDMVSRSVRSGGSLGLSLEKTELFPPMLVHMTTIGEETGALDSLLMKVADFYDEEVDMAVKNLTAAIEPMITVFLAGVVAVILLSVFMPMAKMMQVMGE
ncbi:MAG: type II secretion system F family protein [Firmicutes bacterium]|nr:type II secretion system F family protein [Bacillota bacterium]